MRRNLLLTCLLSLVATFAMAQQTAKWPIVLTTADGLPGERIVRNYFYQSKVFELDEAVSTLRFTVISTNTTDSLTEGSYDGLSAGWGPGFPFFTMSEFRVYNGEGTEIEYVASSNAVSTNDGGGLEALSDKNEGTYLHTTYSFGDMPQAYHYIELELVEPVTSFYFNWNTRSDYHKNLITYMGITPGTEFFPFPEQEFQIGEQVKDVETLKEEGALYVIQGNSPDFNHVSGENLNRWYVGASYYHSPYGAAITPSAASLIYLTADPEVENGYKVSWINNGHSLIAADYNANGNATGQFHWTNNDLKAGTLEFALATDSAEMEGKFNLFMNDRNYIASQNPRCRMDVSNYSEGDKGNFYWTIYKASIKGSAVKGELQKAIDEAQARIDAIGGAVENDEGEYEALEEALTEARALVANPEVTAAEIITAKRNLNMLTGAYAAVGLWVYIDSIDVIMEAVNNDEILVSSAPNWIAGSYTEDAFLNLGTVSEEAMIVIDTYQSLADVDAAIAAIYEAIDAFWASKVSNVYELPFRVGSTDDGLPGTMQSYGGYKWESPVYNLTEETDALRFTFFKTNNNAKYSGTDYVFTTFAEVEFYDGGGNKIELTEDCFECNAMMTGGSGDRQGYAALCDGKLSGSWAHTTWTSGQVAEYDENPTYVYLEIAFPEPISSFKYVQYGRQNGVNTPTDFVIGAAGEAYTPDDVVIVDSYNTKVGEQITDASQITDDGFYALVGLLNCAPEGNGEGFEKYYSSNVNYGKNIAAPAVFSIRKTGDEDGSFYIQSLADGKYWAQTIDDDGWGAGTITAVKAEAGKFRIESMNREAYGKEAYPNTFVIYQYNDTVKRDDIPHPYVVVQDWGNNTGYFSIDSLQNNDWDGEGEWKIFKVTMNTPHCYWLKALTTAAEAMNLQVGPDPGFYSEESAGAYAAALAKAQNALAANDDATAKAAIPELEAAMTIANTAEKNPMVEGIYILESAYKEYFIKQGEKKAMCVYYNDFEATGPESEYSMYWAKAPDVYDWEKTHKRYMFKFIPATNDDRIQILLEDEVIDSTLASQAYYIQNLETGLYIGTSAEGNLVNGTDIGMTENQDCAYMVRPQGAYKFDILWTPAPTENIYAQSLHTESHSSGSGGGGDIVLFSGSSEGSQWILRKIDDGTSINNNVAEEGDVVVSESYYTVDGAAIAAPVKGMNIVKKVYANGVVKAEKVFVK